MPLNILVGTQWGDEGKGRIVDLLSARSDYVVRYNGGDNAGHTVTVDRQTFKLHLIPSGIIHPHTLGILGNGLVINPKSLLTEMDMLTNAGIAVNPQRLKISYAAHLITPGHIALDKAKEAARGKGQIGTTGRGIGPAYTDKAARSGLRMYDLLSADQVGAKVRAHLELINHQLVTQYTAEPVDIAAVVADFEVYAQKLAPYIIDTGALLDEALNQGKVVLAEGAQGILLDIDHGSYPFVTSSNVTATGVFTGLGIGIHAVGKVTGATKCFQSRVGAGPFPTELDGEMALFLRGTGSNPWDEFGTTTGRPRRVGWLDGVLLRYARRINGLTDLVLTKLDVLSGLREIQVCVAYRDAGGNEYAVPPMGVCDLETFQPVYESLPGWQADLTKVRQWKDLPEAAQNYVRFVEKIGGVPVSLVSVGPERSQVVEVPA
ncbi:MAG: adenylosuccinate synthase [Chloroflexi bacterium HGW-Chloroflexi-10]|nr:MAG: adenylosuccinate synthase [Chloroflexi bacterium HGW-Chloroflexi-10]